MIQTSKVPTNDVKPYHGEVNRAFQLSLPTLFAYFPLGAVFGILFTHLGYYWLLAPIMSSCVYGGSVQLVALGMMNQHSGMLPIVLATVFIALRNSFYGLSLLERFNTRWPLKTFLIFGLVDATYAALMANPPREGENDIKFCFYLTLFIYSYWVGGTLAGAVFANYLPSFSGLSFILPCFFMVLVIEYYFINKSIIAVLVPIIAAVVAYWLNHDNYLIIAILISMGFIFMLHISKRMAASS